MGKMTPEDIVRHAILFSDCDTDEALSAFNTLQHRNKALVDSLTEIAYHTSEGEALQQKDFMALCQDIHESASAALAANGDTT